MSIARTLRSRLVGVAGLAGAMAVLSAPQVLAQNTSPVAVDTVVATECNIAVTPLAFGAYDPVVANASAHLDATATVTLTCTKGAVASVALNPGLYASGAGRRMRSNTGDHLAYQLHQDSTRLFAWGDDILSMLTLGAARRWRRGT